MMIAYQNLYGPITPARMDLVAARLGMDIAAPHMRKGSKPKMKDHLIVWSRAAQRKTAHQILETIKSLQAGFEANAARQEARRARKSPETAQEGSSAERTAERVRVAPSGSPWGRDGRGGEG